MANQVYDPETDDDKKQGIKDDFDSIVGHNFKPGEEDQMEASARDDNNAGSSGVPESDARASKNRRAAKSRRNNMERTGGILGGGSLADQENAAGTGAENSGQAPLSGQLKDAEGAGGWAVNGGKDDSDEPSLKLRIKQIPTKRKVLGLLGVGGIVVLVLTAFTLGPVFRVPSLMNGLLSKVAEEVLDVGEDRAQRLIISYLIQAAGGNPNDFVIEDSLYGTLVSTFRTNRLEDKIYQKTGLKIVNEDGKILLVLDHGDRELLKSQIKNYDDVVKLLDNPDLSELSKRELRKAMRTIIRTIVPYWRYSFSAPVAEMMRKKYGSRFDAPHYDPSKSREENAKAFRERMIDSVSRQTIGRMTDLMRCVTQLECDAFKKGSKPGEADKPPDGVEESGDKFSKATEEAYPEARSEAAAEDPVKTQTGFTTKLTAKVSLKLAAAGTGVGLVYESIVLMTHLWQLAGEVSDSTLAAGGINAQLVGDATGAQFSDWQGFASNIQAGRMDLFFIGMLNGMVDGAQKATTYIYTYTGEIGRGVPVEDRVNNDFNNPALAFFKYYQLAPSYHINNAIFTVLGAILEVSGAITEFFIDLILNKILQVDELLKAIFGENWEEEFFKWALTGFMKFIGLAVDPLATGAKLFNQLYVGGDYVMNTYCQTNLGCRAMSTLKNLTIGNFDLPILHGPGAVLPDRKLDVAVLPLSERLFSLEEPNSLLNEGIRALPTNNNPVEWASGILRQVGATPSQLFSAFSGHSSAVANDTTPDQDAAVSGVRQFGWNTEDKKQEIAIEVRTQKDPVCPEYDPETSVSACIADKEVIKTLMCDPNGGGNCSGYNIGRLDRHDTGLWANLRQLWSGRQSMATW